MAMDYNPKPADAADTVLPRDVTDSVETLARNIHDTWAARKLADGFTFGAEDDPVRRTHPCLVPYEQLPENAREYDRATALCTIRTMVGLGFEIRKRKGGAK